MLHFLLYLLMAIGPRACEKEWSGVWFPQSPENKNKSLTDSETSRSNDTNQTLVNHKRIPMGVENEKCDDAHKNLGIDFDPYDIRHSTVYMCLDNRRDYRGDYNMEPLITVYDIPDAYVALHKCMNTSIQYAERIPTFGTHRPLWPRYGEYKYVPPQRWVHNSEHGAVIALYHPCANKHQIEELKLIVKSCLYRHIITPSDLPSKDRPFAIVAWGALLEFSVLQRDVVENFIRTYALKGPEQISRDGQYDHLLLAPAQVVSTIDDDVLCPKHRKRD
ncbi:uncharacterized protein LOC129769051 [Toxorhynchites rutilus septentrionalis]|uniref:uncharacterized protein LOC129769051 n=1 Tax=Toxorhynchites rutilus septentrionalis TaxID=329112 RepID=UPI0024792364|nr:uncharacterized protein LOC129769051 [Toxorhynchites rutilus septentrionalis]